MVIYNFKNMNNSYTIGEVVDIKRYINSCKDKHAIFRIDIKLLRDYLRRIKTKEGSIGIYKHRNKNGLYQLHHNKIVLATIVYDKFDDYREGL